LQPHDICLAKDPAVVCSFPGHLHPPLRPALPVDMQTSIKYQQETVCLEVSFSVKSPPVVGSICWAAERCQGLQTSDI
jgi:hypothetical protein